MNTKEALEYKALNLIDTSATHKLGNLPHLLGRC